MVITALDYYLAFGLAGCFAAALAWAPLQKIARIGMWIFGLAFGSHLGYDLSVATADASSAAILVDALVIVLGAIAGALVAGWLVAVTRD